MVLGRSSKKDGKKHNVQAGSSSSRHVHRVYSSTTRSGLNVTKREILTPLGLQKQQEKDRQAYTIRMNTLPSRERAELEAICSGDLEEHQEINESENVISIDDILAGDISKDISHARGELSALADDLLVPASR